MRVSMLLLVCLAVVAGQESLVREPIVSAPVRVGLALSGGAALGIAHIGVLKVFEREGIEVCAISGNSMGAMVGGLASAGYSAAQMESIAVAADYPQLFSASVPFGARYLPERQQETRYLVQLRHRNLFPSLPSGLVPLQNVELLLAGLLADIEYNTQFDFDSLPVPYRAVAVDLVSGQREVLSRGRLTHAIRASIAIPGVFAPLQEGGRELVDGGVHQYLPVEPLLEFKPDVVIAVLTMKRNPETGVSLIDIVSRTTDIVGMADLKKQLAMADLVIEPNVDPFRHSDFARARQLIAAGESAAVKALPEIRRLLAGRVPIGRHKAVTYRPRPVVRSVRFEGLDITRPSLLVRELRTWSGTTLDFAVLIDDMRRLFNTGLFEHVDYRLEFPAPGMVDVVLAVKERAYGFYSLGVRYDVRDGVLVGVELGQGNLVGSGAGVRTALTVGNPDELRLGVSGTRLFGLPFGYRLDAFSGLIEYDYYPDEAMPFVRYSLRYHGGLGEAGYVLGRDAFFTVGYQGFRAVYRGAAPLDTLRPEWISGPRFRVEVNRLDDLYLPTRGRWLRFGGVVSRRSMGSSRNFMQATLAGGAVIPVGVRLSLRPSMDAGLSLGVPAWAAYYRTGGESMTGFAPDEFTTPQRIVFRMGMDVLVVHLFGQRDYPLSIRLQSDVATFERPDNILAAGDPRRFLHWGSGVGLVTNTPLGPLVCMLSYGDYLKPRPHHGGFNFTLTVGRDFRYER